MTIDRIGSLTSYQPEPRARVEPPAKTTPAAELLTAEERAYFADVERLGHLTYGPRTRPAPSVAPPLGQRIDVRA
ncbi:MAG: hypothetical protein AB7R55_02875 [Gemmatimonadales bacterium]